MLKKVLLSLGGRNNLSEVAPTATSYLTLPQTILQECFGLYNYTLMSAEFEVVDGYWLITIIANIPECALEDPWEAFLSKGAQIMKVKMYLD